MSFMEFNMSSLSESFFKSPGPSVDPELKILLQEHLLESYESRLIEQGILTVEQLRQLSANDLEKLIPEKPVHARRLAGSSPAQDAQRSMSSPKKDVPRSPRASRGSRTPVNLRERRIMDSPRTSTQSTRPIINSNEAPGEFSIERAAATQSPLQIKRKSAEIIKVADESKKTRATLRLQKSIRKVMLATRTIRSWRVGLGAELMEIIRTRNKLVENVIAFKSDNQAMKLMLKLTTVSDAIAKMVQIYKVRNIRPSFPASQVSLFLEYMPGDICHGERCLAAIALVDCMDCSEAGDVADAVGCTGSTKNAEDGFGFWKALDPNNLTPHLHPLLAHLLAAQGAQRDAAFSADYLERSLNEVKVQCSFLVKSFAGKKHWRRLSDTVKRQRAASAPTDDIPPPPPSSNSPPLPRFSQRLSRGSSSIVASMASPRSSRSSFSPNTFSTRNHAQSTMDAGTSLHETDANPSSSSREQPLSAKAVGNEEEQKARALKRYSTTAATNFVLSAAASSERCLDNAREAVVSADAAYEGLNKRVWSTNSIVSAQGSFAQVSKKENFCLPSNRRTFTKQKLVTERGKDLADMLYDTTRRSVMMKQVKSQQEKSYEDIVKEAKEAYENDDENPQWIGIANTIESTVHTALIKMENCLSEAKQSYERACRLVRDHRKEWSEKLPVLTNLVSFREDLTCSFVEPYTDLPDFTDDPSFIPGEIRALNIANDKTSTRAVRSLTITEELSAKEERMRLMKQARMGGFSKQQGRLNKEVEAVEKRALGWSNASKLITLLRNLHTVAYVALPSQQPIGVDAKLAHSNSIKEKQFIDTSERMEAGSEVEIRVDVFTGEVTSAVILKGSSKEGGPMNPDPSTTAAASRSRGRLSFMNRNKQELPHSPSSKSIEPGSQSSPNGSMSVAPTRFSITDSTQGIIGSIKMAIGMAREEVSRKVYFTLPEGVVMGDSVLVVTPPTHEDTIDAHLASASDLTVAPAPIPLPKRRHSSMKLSGAILGTNQSVPTKYPAVEAEMVEISPVHQGCDVLRSHHRNRRKTAEAFFNLGVMYTCGQGLKFDQSKAVGAWEVAAAMGHGQAQNNLGIMYANGDGVKRNDTRAVEMYMKASNQGIHSADYNLGNMLAHGRGTKKNEAAAIGRWLRAAREGHLGAHFNVAVMFEKGLGLKKPDPVRAIAHYTAAAEKGHKDANFNLAFMYHHGAEGVAPSNSLALRYYSRAAQYGDREAELMLQRLKK